MKKGSESKAYRVIFPVAAVIVFLLGALSVGCAIIFERQRSIDRAVFTAEKKAEQLQFTIERRLMGTELLKAAVIGSGGENYDFERVAREIYSGDGAIRGVQTAPGGIISESYPIAGNEEGAIDLLSDTERGEEARWAMETGKLTLSGPYELLQGGMGLVGRNPIYLDGEFWGFGIVILGVPEIFDDADLNSLTESGYYYRIWRDTDNPDEIQTIYSNTTEQFDSAVHVSIPIANVTWHLSITPGRGWVSARYIAVSVCIGILVALLLIAAIYFHISVVRQRGRLESELNTDYLTGLYNYHFFREKTAELVADKTPFALFCLDLDNFRDIVDKYGHGEGDNLISEVADRIRVAAEGGIAARTGADEFAVIIPTDGAGDFCIEMKEKLRIEISAPYELFDSTVIPFVSIGYARYPTDSANGEKLLWLAESRLNRDKKRPK